MEHELGQLVYSPNNPAGFDVRVQQDESEEFVSLTQDSLGSYWITVDTATASLGNYHTEFIIEDSDDNGTEVTRTIDIQTNLQVYEQEEDFDDGTDSEDLTCGDDDDCEKGGNGSGVNGSASDSAEDVDLDNFYKANKKSSSQTLNIPPGIAAYNEQIKKPIISKISPSGAFDLIFSEERHIELDEFGFNVSRRLEIDEDSEEEANVVKGT